MKKITTALLLTCSFLTPITSIAGDSYDPSTGIVYMPNVKVGTDIYEVSMIHQGNLTFKVTSAKTLTWAFTTPDTFDASTGHLYMPNVAVEANNFEVNMLHQGDLVFAVTTATQTNFNFTTDYLNGKTLYCVCSDEDDSGVERWGIVTITFTDSTVSAFRNSNPDEILASTPYSITQEGYITFIAEEDNGLDDGTEPNYIKATGKTADYITLKWSDSLEHINRVSDDEEYFFFNLQKAQDFINFKNSEISANSETITISGKVSFVDSHGNEISVPSDAGIRIVSDIDAQNNNWSNGFTASINSDGTFSKTKSVYRNSYKTGHTFQVNIFKNHLQVDELEFNCGESVYKSSNASYEDLSNIQVLPQDFQDRSGDNCSND